MSDLTGTDHWDATWSGDIRLRLPSGLVTAVRDQQRLLRNLVRQGDRVLEVGCAPGKILAWVQAYLGASVSGLDFSERGLSQARRLFSALHLDADLRREDLRETTFAPASFDLVYSVGVIEHFDDPRDIVRHHLALVRPGGKAVMTVPNYGGVYGTIQRYFDAESLTWHNLDIMSPEALLTLAPLEPKLHARSYPFGRVSAWVISLSKRWPTVVSLAVSHAVNVVALLQPADVAAVCPMLVLEITKTTD